MHVSTALRRHAERLLAEADVDVEQVMEGRVPNGADGAVAGALRDGFDAAVGGGERS